jgi:hypothetical protein
VKCRLKNGALDNIVLETHRSDDQSFVICDCVTFVVFVDVWVPFPYNKACNTIFWWRCSNCAVEVFKLCGGGVQIVRWRCSDCAVEVFRLCGGGVQIVRWRCSDCAVEVFKLCGGGVQRCSNCVVQVFKLCQLRSVKGVLNVKCWTRPL